MRSLSLVLVFTPVVLFSGAVFSVTLFSGALFSTTPCALAQNSSANQPNRGGPSDQGIRGRIRADFKMNNLRPILRAFEIDVNQGVVTIAGTVGTEEERQLAGRLAAEAPGVRRVINNLQVSGRTLSDLSSSDLAPTQQVAAAAENVAMSLMFYATVGVFFLLAVGGTLFIYMAKRKTLSDRESYQTMTGKSRVKTFTNPEDYAKAIEEREKHRR